MSQTFVGPQFLKAVWKQCCNHSKLHWLYSPLLQ